MERQAHYALVGLVTLVVAIGLLAFTFWFIKFDFNNSFSTYDVEFDTPVDGLTKGAEVHFNGIKVGEVTSLRLGNANTHQVIAEVQIDSKTPVRVDSVASLEPQGITGLYYMQISPGTARARLLLRQPDGPPPVIHSQESALAKLLTGSGSVIENTYESLNRVNRLLSDKNLKAFSDSLDNLQAVTADLRSRKQLLDDAHEAIISASQAADAVTKLANTSNDVVGKQLPATAQSIDAAAVKLGNAADNVSKLTAAIEAPAHQLNTQTLPELQESLRNLNEATASLKQLTDQAQQSPQSLLNKPAAREKKGEPMTIVRNPGHLLAASALTAALSLTLALGGCVTLLPKQQPVQLYRFGYDPASLGKDADRNAVSQSTFAPAPLAIALGQVHFPEASSFDRITTTEGDQVAYVGGSRWAVPANVLFNEALSDGFSRAGHGLQLEPRGPSAAAFRLDLSVRKFETAYHHGKATVTVEFDARLTRTADHSIVADRYITADVGLQHNDMGDMVEGYDKATTQAIMTLIAFCQDATANASTPDAVPMPAPGTVPVAK